MKLFYSFLKNVTMLTVVGIFSITTASAQCSGRYFDEVFPGFYNGFTPSLPGAVQFGEAPDYQGANTILDMYVFEPDGDTAAKRPLVMLAFGGSFTAGAKESPDVLRLCDYFVRRGYIAVSIKYRIGANPIDSINMLKAVVRGVHDAKAALRFFYKDAATTNTYRVDTNNIFMGGVSAGGLIGIHTAYMTDTIGVPAWIQQIITELTPSGNLEGESGNPGYSSKIKGVISLSGSIGDTLWIEADEPPMVSMHGNSDGTVPYCSEIINVSGTDIITVHGGASMKVRTNNIGLKNNFYTWVNADHVPFTDPVGLITGVNPYMDTTTRFVRNFLFEMVTGNVCDENFISEVPFETFCSASSGIQNHDADKNWAVYPNPSSGVISVERKTNSSEKWNAEIYNSTGQLVSGSYNIMEQRHQLSNGNGAPGLYFVRIFNNKNETSESVKVIFE